MRVKKSPAPPVRLYKVCIEKLILNKPKPTERERANARRVVVVSRETVERGNEFLLETLRKAGVLDNTTGRILEVLPANDCVVLSS